MKSKDILPLEAAFPLAAFYCPPAEVIETELRRSQRGHFNLIHETGFKADIYLCGGDDLHVWGLTHARRIPIEDDVLWLAPPEYVIVRKLQVFREGHSEKHLRDISRMLISMGDSWDLQQLHSMVREHCLEAEWQQVLDYDR